MLTLAESEHAVVEGSVVDLADIAAHVLSNVGAAADGISVRSDLATAATRGDPVLLERLTHNLIDNAIRHNVGVGGWLTVRTGVLDGQVTLAVANSGTVVPPYELDALFEPFRRLGGDRGIHLAASAVFHRGDLSSR